MNEHFLNSPATDDDAFLANHYGKGPKGYKKTDEHILEDVCECLFKDRMVVT